LSIADTLCALFAGAVSADEGPATSDLSAEEADGSEAPILIKFSRKKDPLSSAADSMTPTTEDVDEHTGLSEAQTPGKRKRGRPPGSAKRKEGGGKRGRPRKQSAEADGRPEERAGSSDQESADLGADGVPERSPKKSRNEENEAWGGYGKGLESGAKVSPIQLQRKALQHTRPRSVLGRNGVKGAEDGTESVPEVRETKVLTAEERQQVFLEGVAKFKEKKRKRQELGRQLSALRRGETLGGAEMAGEKGGGVSEASSRSTGGLKGLRSKRRPRVFVKGGSFWLQLKGEEGEEIGADGGWIAPGGLDGKRPAKKLRIGTEVGEKVGGSAAGKGAAEGIGKLGGVGDAKREALSNGDARVEGAEAKTLKVQIGGNVEKRRKSAHGGNVVAGGEGDGVLVGGGQVEGVKRIRVLSRSLEPHRKGSVTEGGPSGLETGGRKGGQTLLQRDGAKGVDGRPKGPSIEAVRKGKKRGSVENADSRVGARDQTGGVSQVGSVEVRFGEGQATAEVGEDGASVGAAGGGRRKGKKRRWGKRKRGPKTHSPGEEALVRMDVAGAVLPAGSTGGGEEPPAAMRVGIVQRGVGNAQLHNGRKGLRGGPIRTLAANGPTDKRKEGADRLGSAGGEQNLLIDLDDMDGLSMLGMDVDGAVTRLNVTGGLPKSSGLQVYRRRKGRGAEVREREGGMAPPVEADQPTEKDGLQGGVIGSKREGKWEGELSQRKQKSSGLIVKGMKGFQKKHQAVPGGHVASLGRDVAATSTAEGMGGQKEVEIETEERKGSGSHKKETQGEIEESRASGLIVKGVRGFQKKRKVELRDMGMVGEETAGQGAEVHGGEALWGVLGGEDGTTGGENHAQQLLATEAAQGDLEASKGGAERNLGENGGTVDLGREPAALQAFEKAGGKGKKKGKRKAKKGGYMQKVGAESDGLASGKQANRGKRLDLVEKGAGLNGNIGLAMESVHVEAQPAGQEEGGGKEVGREKGGQLGEENTPKATGKKVRVSRELQALQAAAKGTGMFEGGKTDDDLTAIASTVSITRQRFR
jgi:hypothetical protein